ncbi:TonB-dependent receptor domain-containing protein [Halioxenophilus aromaticivorans]
MAINAISKGPLVIASHSSTVILASLLSASTALAQSDAATDSEIEQVVVTAAGYQQKIIDAPASISVVTAEQLRKQAYTSIVDAVRDIPGVYVNGGGNMQDISIRGMDDAYTLYLVDGRPISAGRNINTNGSDGGKQIAMPPLAMIERVEVIRGPMSSLYGSEAMGGVINIITRATPQEWTGNVAANYVNSMNDITNDEYTTDLYLAGSLIDNVLGLAVTGSLEHTDESDFSGGDDGASSQPELDTQRFGGELTWQANQSNRIGLSYDYANTEFDRTPGKSISADSDPSNYEYEKELLTLTHDGSYGALTTSTFLQQDTSKRVQTDDKEEEIVTLNTQMNYAAGPHIYTFGGRYKTEELVDETNGLLSANVAGAVATVDRWIAAVFAEVEWNFFDDIAITTGLRYDDDELFGGHVSPRIYGNWTISDSLTLKTGVSTGYSQPSLPNATEGFGRGTGGGGSPNLSPSGDSISRALIVGNSELEPETSINYEMGLHYHDRDKGLSSSVTVYQTDFKDKIAEDRYCTSPDSVDRNDYLSYTCEYGGNTYYFLSTRQNIDEAQIRGLEASVKYNLTQALSLTADMTLTKSELQSGEFAGEPLNKIPKRMANLGLDWDINFAMNVWGRVNYRGETSDYLGRTSVSEGTPGYTMVDIGGSYNATESLQLMLGLYNVANKEVTNDTFGVVLDGRRLDLSVSYSF